MGVLLKEQMMELDFSVELCDFSLIELRERATEFLSAKGELLFFGR